MQRRGRRRPAHDSRTTVVGVDTGGTFTDIVYRKGGRIGVFKILSTPADPADAVLAGLRTVLPEGEIERVTYGTTVATNAMLERRGARTVVLLTAGFEDLLEIGRQARPDLYDLEPLRSEPLARNRACIGVRERLRHDGSVALALTRQEIQRVMRAVRRTGAESIAVCLLHAHVDSRHERALERALRSFGLPISLSSRIAPIRGEYERASTVVANAFVSPKMASHLHSLHQQIQARTLHVMQSNGGAIGVSLASKEPIRTMLSGPAGGVAAATDIAIASGFHRAVSFDMGGTSTDVALIDEIASRRQTTDIGGIPIVVPTIDIHTVGAGGGSIASVDAGGALRVGPESAGAEPGPACYGGGTRPTVTDATVVLGRLRPDAFLGGHMRLNVERARRALAGLARAMGVRSETVAAEGVVRVVENSMERAIRLITIERGQDPRSCVLIAFGGAAGLHACGLATELGIRSVLIPNHPGVLSARGMLTAPLVHDLTRSVVIVDPGFPQLRRIAGGLEKTAIKVLVSEGVSRREVKISSFAQFRYLGEGSALEVPLTPRAIDEFRRTHGRLFRGAGLGNRQVECTAIRISATAKMDHGRKREGEVRRKSSTTNTRRENVWVEGKYTRIPCYERSALAQSRRLKGPALVSEYSSSLFLPAQWSMTRLRDGELLLER
jgi:N-methylhydantoinase A